MSFRPNCYSTGDGASSAIAPELSRHNAVTARSTAAAAPVHGCQMAIAGFLDCMYLALRASGLWLRYATLQNMIPSFPWTVPPCPPPWLNPRKGRDQILPSGNTD